jgi:hypothetical protein
VYDHNRICLCELSERRNILNTSSAHEDEVAWVHSWRVEKDAWELGY